MPQVPVVRVFVSSTWLDLEPERRAAERAVQRLRETKFVGMEHFGSRDETTRRASLDEVGRSDVYVGIFGARHGSGITEAEYRRARELHLPCFIYFKDDATIADDLRETDPAKTEQLSALKHELRTNHLNAPDFINPQDLAAKLTADLHNWLFEKYLTPKLEAALTGNVPRTEAQALLDSVKDADDLPAGLRLRLQVAGYNVSIGGDVVGRDKVTNVYHGAAPTVSARHQLRAPVVDFVGREQEIKTLTAALAGGGVAGISGISGMGGIGKTELSLYVANRLRGHYPDAQLFVDMRGTDEHPRDPREALADCIRAFHGPEQRLPEALDDLVKIYRAALDGQRALILLDNAHDAAQVKPLLPPAGSALLVTSRETIPLPGMRRLTLEQLPPDKARELLTGIIQRPIPTDTADQICYLCGYLPLALRAAGSLLDITLDLDPAYYAQQLSDERTRLANIGTAGVDLGVEASISLSYRRLTPAAARVFRLLSVFPATFDAPAEEVICEDKGHQHLSDLLRRNLVLYNPDTKRYRLHDLTRLFASARTIDDERSPTQMRHAKHYLDVLLQTNKLYLQGGEALKHGLALFDLEWRNIQAGQAWAENQSGEKDTAASLCINYPNVGAVTLDLRQHPRDKIRWLEAALATARRLKKREAEGLHLSNLGTAYLTLGDYRRAIEIYEQRLVIAREFNDRRAEGITLGNLGTAYINLNEPQRAIEIYEQRLVIAREFNDQRGEGAVLGNLGVVYRILGENRRAIEFSEQALAINRRIGARRAEGDNLGNLGNAYAVLGESRRAAEFYKQQLDITREIGDRRGEGNALFNASLVLNKLGDNAQAIARAEAALKIFEQIESPHVEMVRRQIDEWRGQG